MLVLAPITRDNLPDALGVRLTPAESHRVAPAALMLAKCHDRPGALVWHPFLIAERGEPVGIVAVSIDRDDRLGGAQSAWVHNLLIQAEAQGRGLGRAAVAAILDWLAAEHPSVRRVGLNVRAGNDAAFALYSSFGFGDVGRTRDGRTIMLLEV